jgi:hypothetical protein
VARAFYLFALLALIAAGCDPGASARKKMEGTRAPEWPALKAMNGDGGLITVGMSMQTQGPKAAQKAAAAPAFSQLLDSFEKEAIPSEFATAEREAAKKTFVESLRGIAKGGSDDEIKALWDKARESMGTMGRP